MSSQKITCYDNMTMDLMAQIHADNNYQTDWIAYDNNAQTAYYNDKNIYSFKTQIPSQSFADYQVGRFSFTNNTVNQDDTNNFHTYGEGKILWQNDPNNEQVDFTIVSIKHSFLKLVFNRMSSPDEITIDSTECANLTDGTYYESANCTYINRTDEMDQALSTSDYIDALLNVSSYPIINGVSIEKKSIDSVYDNMFSLPYDTYFRLYYDSIHRQTISIGKSNITTTNLTSNIIGYISKTGSVKLLKCYTACKYGSYDTDTTIQNVLNTIDYYINNNIFNFNNFIIDNLQQPTKEIGNVKTFADILNTYAHIHNNVISVKLCGDYSGQPIHSAVDNTTGALTGNAQQLYIVNNGQNMSDLLEYLPNIQSITANQCCMTQFGEPIPIYNVIYIHTNIKTENSDSIPLIIYRTPDDAASLLDGLTPNIYCYDPYNQTDMDPFNITSSCALYYSQPIEKTVLIYPFIIADRNFNVYFKINCNVNKINDTLYVNDDVVNAIQIFLEMNPNITVLTRYTQTYETNNVLEFNINDNTHKISKSASTFTQNVTAMFESTKSYQPAVWFIN